MESLYEVLSQEDKDKIIERMLYCGGECGESINKVDLPSALLGWSANKHTLYKLLGENLIVEEPFSVRKSPDMISEDIWRNLLSWDAHYKFRDIFSCIVDGFRWQESHYFTQHICTKPIESVMHRMSNHNTYELGRCLRHLFSSLTLATNIYDDLEYESFESFEVPSLEVGGRPLKINKGCKAIKALGKIVDFWNLDKEAFEEFRLAHSLCLNQKNLEGTLCLSIHPLDYITMSDNTYGWSSCMSWIDGGDYRQGTLEMMSSKYVIVAYLKGEEEMYLNYSSSEEDAVKWNSKKWRQLFVVSSHMLLGIKPYPYDSDAMTTTALGILRDKAIKNLGWNFDNTISKINNNSENILANTTVGKSYISLSMNHMYNDIGCGHFAYVSRAIPDRFNLYLSGEAYCLTCGAPLYDEPENSLLCCEHGGGYRCDCCGQSMGDDYYVIGDSRVCEYCYAEETFYCPVCEEREWNSCSIPIYLKCGDMKSDCCVEICESCLEHSRQAIEEMFGTIVEIKTLADETSRWPYAYNYMCADVTEVSEDTLKWYFNYLGPRSYDEARKENLFKEEYGAVKLDLSSEKKIV